MSPLIAKSQHTAIATGKAAVLRRQLEWANGNGIPVENGYCLQPEHNLPWLSESIRQDVEEGDGNEFGQEGKRGKICALHSSSALSLNFFGYWTTRDRAPLGEALKLTSAIQDVRFERKYDTGVPPRSPNLDVVLSLADGTIFAIESKFNEWFGTSGKKPLRDAYLPKGNKRWERVGLSGAQATAESFLADPGFNRLDVPQLLKHMLGLATQPKPWHLTLLWFKEPGETAAQMEAEILRFRQRLGPDSAKFSAMTYQDLWAVLQPLLGDDHRGYEQYLGARYFNEALAQKLV